MPTKIHRRKASQIRTCHGGLGEALYNMKEGPFAAQCSTYVRLAVQSNATLTHDLLRCKMQHLRTICSDAKCSTYARYAEGRYKYGHLSGDNGQQY